MKFTRVFFYFFLTKREPGKHWLQMTQPTSGGAVTTVLESLCANCVETSTRFTVLGKPALGRAVWLALLLIKVSDVETNPGPRINHIQVWICDICHK